MKPADLPPGADDAPAGLQPAPPELPDASPDSYELPIAGFCGSPEEIEQQWFERCYRGRGDRMLQLTWRAIIMGSLLGGILALTNLYIGLRAGWAFGVAITACILSYALWTTLYRAGLVKTRMSILENNCMQSTASAAGYSTGGTLISAVAAYMLVNGHSIPTGTLMAWVFFLAVLGVTMAIPMKRQMINVEQLRFPSGVAAAETLKALHTAGGQGLRSAKALGVAGLLAAANKFWMDGLVRFGSWLGPFQLSHWVERLNLGVFGPTWMSRTVMLSWEPMFIAAGAITGMRVCASMMLGTVLCWMVYVPILGQQMATRGVVIGSTFKEVVQWTLWGGAACMVTSGLLSFGLEWRSAVRAFGSLGRLVVPNRRRTPSKLDAIETPASWFLAGQVIATVALAYIGRAVFGMPILLTVFAVVFSFALALVACRVCGETDTTPTGPMGKVTQLTFGGIRPGDKNVNLMAASITAGAADSSSDLLLDLKSGYLLGAHPRKQFLAQFAGIFMGTLVSVLGFKLIVPSAEVLGTARFPAPSALTWKAVADALGTGLAALGPVKTWSIVIGGAVGIVLPLLERLMPKYRNYVPSAAGLGLAWTFGWYTAFLFFIGGVAAWAIEQRQPKLSADYLFPVASGVIAGEGLMAVALIFWENAPQMWRQVFGG